MTKATPRQRSQAAEVAPPAPWLGGLSSFAFVLALGLVAARATMLETLRDPFEAAFGVPAAPGGPGAGTSVWLDLICCVPAILVLVRWALDRTFALNSHWSHLALIAFGAWAAVSTLWAADKFAAIVGAAHLVSAGVLLWSVSQLVRDWRRLRIVAGLALGLLLIFLAEGLVYRFIELPDLQATFREQREQIFAQRGWEPDSFHARQFANKILSGEMMGFSGSPNTFAAVIVMLSIVTAGTAIQRAADRDEPAWSVGTALALPVALLILYYTRSRTALAVLALAAVGLATLRWVRPWLARHHRMAFLVGAGGIAVVILAVVGHGLYHGSLFHDSLNFRWRYWVGSWGMFAEHPLRGVGWDNFGLNYLAVRVPAAAEEIRDPHNMLVRAFTELGLIGGVVMLAWLARYWWEATRPVSPPPPPEPDPIAIRFAPPPPPFHVAIAPLFGVAAVATGLMIAFGIDFTQSLDYTFVELFNRLLFGTLLLGGLIVGSLRSARQQDLDDRPAPWVLAAVLVALGGFLLHAMLDVALFEVGPMFVFATLAGAALGVRTAANRGERRAGPTAASIGVLAAALLAWGGAAVMLAVPVASAQAQAAIGDAAVRAGRFDVATAAFRRALEIVPYNADYAFRAARALSLAGASPAEQRAQLDVAIEANPLAVRYHMARADTSLRAEPPDVESALADYRTALALNPADLPTRLDYARLLADAGHADEAVAQYRDVLARNDLLDPNEPERLTPEQIASVQQQLESLQ